MAKDIDIDLLFHTQSLEGAIRKWTVQGSQPRQEETSDDTHKLEIYRKNTFYDVRNTCRSTV